MGGNSVTRKVVVGSLALVALYLFVNNPKGTGALFGGASQGASGFIAALQGRSGGGATTVSYV